MSPDGENIVWSIADGILLPVELVIVSQNGGQSFRKVTVFDKKGVKVEEGLLKVYSDRCNAKLFYGFGREGQLYVSKDGGLNFYEKSVKALRKRGEETTFPACHFGKIDTANKTEIRGVAGEEGLFYMALAKEGLWKLQYDGKEDIFKTTKLMEDRDSCLRMGPALPPEEMVMIEESAFTNGTLQRIFPSP